MINLGKISKYGKEVILEQKENGCIECISHCKDSCGYTRIMINNKQERLFRYIYEKEYGKIPQKKVIRHKCDNPNCCNIHHLEIGTQKDNVDDREKRNRGNKNKPNLKVRGSKNGGSKLNEEQILNIYCSNSSYNTLSRKYNVSKTTIYAIKKGKWWSWLTKNMAR